MQSVGFRKTTLEFEAQKREAGESKYSIRKLLHFSINALCSFSDLPLKLGMYSGVFVALCGFILMIFTIINKIVQWSTGGVFYNHCSFMFYVCGCSYGNWNYRRIYRRFVCGN